jgi:3-oxoacyl-[acyl-carrier protein] reductase
MNVLGSGEVPKPMHTEIHQRGTVGQAVEYQIARRLRQDGLAAVRNISEASSAGDGRADVVVGVSELYLASVNADSQPHRFKVGPLEVDRASRCGRRPRERDNEAVALALLDGTDTTVSRGTVLERLVEARDRRSHDDRILLPQTGRALDVGEEQRHRSHRQGSRSRGAPPVLRQRLVRTHRQSMADAVRENIRAFAYSNAHAGWETDSRFRRCVRTVFLRTLRPAQPTSKELHMRSPVALVTGAGSGIGAATARRLASDGMHVVVNDRDADTCEKVASDVGGESACFDVTNASAVDDAVAAVVSRHGRLDVLVNNAGVLGLRADITERQAANALARANGEPVVPTEATTSLTDEEFDRMIKVHLYGTFHGTRAALRHMQSARAGAIVNLASIAALRPFPATPHYAAAKAAIVGFTRSVGYEVAPLGIRVNAVAPGFVDTDLLAVAGRPDLTELVHDVLPGRIGVGRLAKPSEIADAIAFLAGDQASFCFGEILTCTGADLGD